MKIVIVSGYFNPVHIGHIEMLKAAKALGGLVCVIVNNDIQQMLKKGKIIMNEDERVGVVKALRYVDMVYLAEDTDRTVCKTVMKIAEQFSVNGYELIFANGGDRNCSRRVPETDICERYHVKMIFDCGGTDKLNSSSSINKLLGVE